ncbi:hypothetical protein BKA64DRAFT_717485 [Cadophora sp. MPI-SDFR-AT-0126]|nr:hypothetical protein BKA64DRAFT_717485 [Leotiomycetes sp. MPI-SDFR-AT-0126]
MVCAVASALSGRISAVKKTHMGGRPTNAVLALQDQGAEKQTALSAVTITPVSYQTFHRSNFTRYFQVATLSEPDWGASGADQPPPPTSLEAQVELQLAEKIQAADARASTVLQPPPEQSAWLQTTEWVRYLQGHDLEAAARLIALPHSSEPEPDLVSILASLDRLVEQARDSVLQGKVNAFDQQRINSFLRSGSRTSKASDRPLAHKLKEGTYKAYKKTWKQLLCFVFRMVHLERQPALHCLLTSAQSAALDEVACAARVFVQRQEQEAARAVI